MVEFHRVTRTSLGTRVRTVLATVLGFGSTGDDENAETAEDCEVIQPLGLVARPALGDGHDVEALIVREGDETIILGFLHKNSTLHDVEAGATELFSDKEPTCRIRLHANGDIAITAKSGQKIVLNGGTQSVGRVDDEVQVTIPTGTFLTAASGGVLNGAPVTVTGKINAGSPNVKA